VPEVGVRAVRLDARVDLISVADPEKTYGATVTRIGAEVGRTRSLIVEAQIDKDTPLKPGMFAEARVTIGLVERPVIPRSALRGKCGKEPTLEVGSGSASKIVPKEKCRGPWRVFVVVKGELEERVVQLGPDSGPGKVSIVQGITAGEKVVEKPTEQTVDGLRVVE
jgi:hypothetical protein